MKSDSFPEFIVDQLASLGGIECRPMFGGHGLYQQTCFFGIIDKGRLYFKVSDKTRADYERVGSEPFQPGPNQTLRTYYEVPADVIDSSPRLTEWATAAISAAKSVK